jgi:hypothetical protein
MSLGVKRLNINRNEEDKDTKAIRDLRESKGRMYESYDSPLNIIGLLYQILSTICSFLMFFAVTLAPVILMKLITYENSIHCYGLTALPCSSHVAIRSSLTYTKQFLRKKVSFFKDSMPFLCDAFYFL